MPMRSKIECVEAIVRISTACLEEVSESLEKAGISNQMDLQRWCYSFFHIASFIEIVMACQAVHHGAKGNSLAGMGEAAFEEYLAYIQKNRDRFRVGSVEPNEIRHFGDIIFRQMFEVNDPIVRQLVFEDQKRGQTMLLKAIAAVYIPERDMLEEEEIMRPLLGAYVNGVEEVLQFFR